MPPAAAPTLPRRALAALVLTGALGIVGAGTAAAQDPTTVPPTSGVLVPGTTAPPSTTPASTTTTEAPAEDEGGLLDLDANEKVWVIVGGLVGIAILMMVLTVLYWRHTRPEHPKQDRRIDRVERKEAKAERKDEKRRRRAAGKDPFTDDGDDGPPPAGPLDLDAILGGPDPARSVFGSSEEGDEPPR
jgi:hypothetical protein